MTSLRWDNVPKPRVERPPLLVSGPNPGCRKQKPSNLRDRIEEVGGARAELQDFPSTQTPPLTRRAPIGDPADVLHVRPEASRCGR